MIWAFLLWTPLAFADCTQVFVSPFTPWFFGAGDIPVDHASEILPEKFVAELEAAGMKLHVVKTKDSVEIKDIRGKPPLNNIARFKIEHGSRPGAARIEGLNLKNPLDKDLDHLKQKKQAKGFPSDVFRHTQARLMELLRAGGFKTIESGTTQDYVVSVLYRRLSQLSPLSEYGKNLFSTLDSYYKLATKEFSEKFRVQDLEEFSRLMGSYHGNPAGYDLAKKNLEGLLKGGVPGYKGIPIEHEGKTIAVGIEDASGKRAGLFFLLPNPQGELEIVSWHAIHKCCRSELVLSRDL